MNKVTITINGESVYAESGENLLAAALSCGFNIPHLCYDPRLEPFGACRLCFVEVIGKDKPIPACSLTVTEGLEIITDSNHLSNLRKSALELLMSEHCGDCLAPCTLACPASIDIQGFIAFINNGDLARAANLIREKMPLPSICGRVCPRFCEDECRRSLVDDSVDICGLKRFVGDFWLEKFSSVSPKVSVSSGFNIAVVGGGPAGLTASYYLALKGHKVSLYEASSELGGMLRYGIPEYRLPKAVLDKEINVITGLCHEIKLNQVLGLDFSLDELKSGYDAVFLGIGCQEALTLGVKNEDLPGIYSGIGFLRDVALERPIVLGQDVAIVGGGNTAMDAARTALRLGAKNVMVMYRRSQEEMPATAIEIKEAMEEGVQFYFLTNPKVLIGEGRVCQVQCVRMELGQPDSSGRRRPTEIPNSEFSVPVDTVIIAIGQKVEESVLNNLELKVTKWGTLATNEWGNTSCDGIFVAGDCVSGAATVVEAIAEAREVAENIDLYLLAKHKKKMAIVNSSTGSLKQQDVYQFANIPKQPRVQVSNLSVSERVTNFKEYSLGLTEIETKQEANRCLECGCLEVYDCQLRKLASEYQIDIGSLGQEKQRYTIDHSHPYIMRDQNKCILCGKCVLLCQEINRISPIGFVHRGYDTVIQYAPGLSEEEVCQSCGQCVSSCPTGALSIKLPWVKRGPWKTERVVETTCLQCSIGCALELHIVGDKIVLAKSPTEHPVSQGALCSKGSFGYDFVHGSDRITTPLVKVEDGYRVNSWTQAMELLSKKLDQVKQEHGSDSIAVLASPRLTNEELYLVHKLARLSLETNNLSSTRPTKQLHQLQDGKLQDIAKADLVILFSTDIKVTNPILSNGLNKCIKQGGKVKVINTIEKLINVVNLLGKEEKTVIVSDVETLTEGKINQLSEIVSSANDKSQIKLLLLCECGNCRGQLVMGIHPHILPGLRLISESHNLHFFAKYYNKALPSKPGYSRDNILKSLQLGELKGLLVIGDDLILDGYSIHPDVFTVAVSANWQSFLSKFSLVLPASTFLESNGTAINVEGRLQKVHGIAKPRSGKENWEILTLLINVLGFEYPIKEINDLVKEIVSVMDSMVMKQSDLVHSKLLG